MILILTNLILARIREVLLIQVPHFSMAILQFIMLSKELLENSVIKTIKTVPAKEVTQNVIT